MSDIIETIKGYFYEENVANVLKSIEGCVRSKFKATLLDVNDNLDSSSSVKWG